MTQPRTVFDSLQASLQKVADDNDDERGAPIFDLSDDMATKVNVQFHGEVREAFIKAIAD